MALIPDSCNFPFGNPVNQIGLPALEQHYLAGRKAKGEKWKQEATGPQPTSDMTEADRSRSYKSLSSMSTSANPAGGGEEAAGHGGLAMQGGGGRAADVNGTPADVCWILGGEPESRKRKAAVVPTQSDYLLGNEGDCDVSNDDSYRISKEIEYLRSQLTLKKKELKCYQQNKKLRVELDLKLKEVECLRKENEELKAQNKDLQNNIVEILDSQIESKKRHLQQTEIWKTRLELSNARLKEEIKILYEGNSEETCCLMSHPSCSNVLKATLEDEVHNLKARDEDHLKETGDLWKQLHVRDQEVKDFSERCKSLEIELITKNDEIDRLCNDLTAKRHGKALIEKSCAVMLASFESKSTAAVKASSDAVKAFRPEKVSLNPDDIQGCFEWMESSFEDLRQAAYLSGYADAMISARRIVYSSFEQKDAQQSGVGIESVDKHAGGQPDTGASGNGAPDEELAPTCDGGPATAYSRPLNGKVIARD